CRSLFGKGVDARAARRVARRRRTRGRFQGRLTFEHHGSIGSSGADAVTLIEALIRLHGVWMTRTLARADRQLGAEIQRKTGGVKYDSPTLSERCHTTFDDTREGARSVTTRRPRR